MSKINLLLNYPCLNIASIIINCPNDKNTLDPQLLDELKKAIIFCERINEYILCNRYISLPENKKFQNSINAIIIEGSNNFFSSGYNLKVFARDSPAGTFPCVQSSPFHPSIDYSAMRRMTDNILYLSETIIPTICKIRGMAIGGGSDIAFSCDISFMTSDSYIGYPPSVLWGCPTTSKFGVKIQSSGIAKSLLFSGELVSAETAVDIGLVDYICNVDKMESTREVKLSNVYLVNDFDIIDKLYDKESNTKCIYENNTSILNESNIILNINKRITSNIEIKNLFNINIDENSDINYIIHKFSKHLSRIPLDQLWYSKESVNSAGNVKLSILFDGHSRHSPEGQLFQSCIYNSQSVKKGIEYRNEEYLTKGLFEELIYKYSRFRHGNYKSRL